MPMPAPFVVAVLSLLQVTQVKVGSEGVFSGYKPLNTNELLGLYASFGHHSYKCELVRFHILSASNCMASYTWDTSNCSTSAHFDAKIEHALHTPTWRYLYYSRCSY